MRKMSSNYRVSYTLNDFRNNNTACYAQLFRKVEANNIKTTDVLTLEEVFCEETHQYLENFTKKLAKLFNLKYEINKNEDWVEISGFTHGLHVKIFVTLYRLLWECYSDIEKPKNIKFLEEFTKSKKGVPTITYLINCYNDIRVWQGGGHGIRPGLYSDTKIKNFKSNKAFLEKISKSIATNSIHSIFEKENKQ